MSPATKALRDRLMRGGDQDEIRTDVEAVAMEAATAVHVFMLASADLKRRGREPGLAGGALVDTIDRAIEIIANWIDEVHGGETLNAKRREGFELVAALVEAKINGQQFLTELLRAKRGGVARVIYREERQDQNNRVANDNVEEEQTLIDIVSARDSATPLQLVMAQEEQANLMAALNLLPWKLKLVLTVLGGVAQSRAAFETDNSNAINAELGSGMLKHWLTTTIGVPESDATTIAGRYRKIYHDVRLRQQNAQVRASGAAIAARDLATLLGVTPGRVAQMTKSAMARVGTLLAS